MMLIRKIRGNIRSLNILRFIKMVLFNDETICPIIFC